MFQQQLSSVSVRKKRSFKQLSDPQLIEEGRVLTELHITINTRSRNMSAAKVVVFTQTGTTSTSVSFQLN
jgi:hypothetical protein